MATIIKLSLKTIEKWRKEDIELHKRVLTNELMYRGVSLSVRNKFFYLYDLYITPANILNYVHKPAWVFIQALVLDKLDQICDFYSSPLDKPKKKRKKRD